MSLACCLQHKNHSLSLNQQKRLQTNNTVQNISKTSIKQSSIVNKRVLTRIYPCKDNLCIKMSDAITFYV